MSKTMSMRELSRGAKNLSDYDYVYIEDRKTHTYKGLFVSEKYAEDVKEFLEKKVMKEKKQKKEALLKYAGIASGDIGENTIQELKKQKKEHS